MHAAFSKNQLTIKKEDKKNVAKNVEKQPTNKKEVVKDDIKPASVKAADKPSGSTGDFIAMGDGLEYKIVSDAPGTQYPQNGDFIELHLKSKIGDSLLFDTREAMQGQPAPFQMQQSQAKGDIMEALKKMTAGDSALVRLDVDSLIKNGVQAEWMKPNTGQKIIYEVKLVSVKSQEQVQKEQAEHAQKQVAIDDKLIQDYLASKKIIAQKTASGIYYKIDRQGKGEKAKAGQTVSVNYTGMLLNGEKFDSNVDPQFQHVQPFDFELGAGNVIKGWDEGIALLAPGAKATLYIPSGLAYGERSPSPKIPANSVMVFEVELISAK